jgi:hypothetical protein
MRGQSNEKAFVYVFQGSVVMQVRGGKQLTLEAGQTFYEAPDDVHIVGRNASKSWSSTTVLGSGLRSNSRNKIPRDRLCKTFLPSFLLSSLSTFKKLVERYGMPYEHYASKVPEVTLGFWVINILATTLGETGGDTVTVTMDLG